ncbi:MAG: hypothetical protein Q7W55_09695 [Pseudohongiella sp.]|nr:hypothetical protein [Pseudohongiella sp.]
MSAASVIGNLERYLSLWLVLCIVAGISLGIVLPDVFQTKVSMEYSSGNTMVSVLIWFMTCQMMVSLDPITHPVHVADTDTAGRDVILQHSINEAFP